jgi:hypothetical protein
MARQENDQFGSGAARVEAGDWQARVAQRLGAALGGAAQPGGAERLIDMPGESGRGIALAAAKAAAESAGLRLVVDPLGATPLGPKDMAFFTFSFSAPEGDLGEQPQESETLKASSLVPAPENDPIMRSLRNLRSHGSYYSPDSSATRQLRRSLSIDAEVVMRAYVDQQNKLREALAKKDEAEAQAKAAALDNPAPSAADYALLGWQVSRIEQALASAQGVGAAVFFVKDLCEDSLVAQKTIRDALSPERLETLGVRGLAVFCDDARSPSLSRRNALSDLPATLPRSALDAWIKRHLIAPQAPFANGRAFLRSVLEQNADLFDSAFSQEGKSAGFGPDQWAKAVPALDALCDPALFGDQRRAAALLLKDSIGLSEAAVSKVWELSELQRQFKEVSDSIERRLGSADPRAFGPLMRNGQQIAVRHLMARDLANDLSAVVERSVREQEAAGAPLSAEALRKAVQGGVSPGLATRFAVYSACAHASVPPSMAAFIRQTQLETQGALAERGLLGQASGSTEAMAAAALLGIGDKSASSGLSRDFQILDVATVAPRLYDDFLGIDQFDMGSRLRQRRVASQDAAATASPPSDRAAPGA